MDEPNGEALTEQLNFGYTLWVQKLQLELNDLTTQNVLREAFKEFMERNKEDGGVSSYSVVCDELNNPPELVCRGGQPSIKIYWTQKDAPMSWVFMFERGPFYEP